MNIRSKLAVVALVASTTAAMVGMAGPAAAAGSARTADSKGTQVLVLDGLPSDVSVGEIQKRASIALGKPLPAVSQVVAVDAGKRTLTPDEVADLLAGKEVSDVKRLGQLDHPQPITTLADVAQMSSTAVKVPGGILVILWSCVVILGLDDPTAPVRTVCTYDSIFLPTFI